MELQLIGSEKRKNELQSLIPNLHIILVDPEKANNVLTLVDIAYLIYIGVDPKTLTQSVQNAIALRDSSSKYSRDTLLNAFHFKDCICPEKEELLDLMEFYK